MYRLDIEKIKTNKDVFRRTFGVNRESLIDLVNSVDFGRYRVGRKSKLDKEFVLLMCLYYLKNYCSFEKVGIIFGVSTSYAWKIVKRTLVKLYKCKSLELDGVDGFGVDSKLIIDGTDVETEKPGYDCVYPLDYYGRKGFYAVKGQVVIDYFSKRVVSVFTGEGSAHDFELFKRSGLELDPKCEVYVDLGYVGIKNYHVNSYHPVKGYKGYIKGYDDCMESKRISKVRVYVEHVIGKLKFFNILGGRVRHMKYLDIWFDCILKVVAGLYNLNLKYS